MFNKEQGAGQECAGDGGAGQAALAAGVLGCGHGVMARHARFCKFDFKMVSVRSSTWAMTLTRILV